MSNKWQGSERVSDPNYRQTQRLIFESSTPGESPPPPPRALFGRDELIQEVIRLVDSLIPVALIGAGGIGKTSIALTILHHDHIKERFGPDNCRFIRCDQFPATQTHFLRRLSEIIGAGINNPEDLTPLRPFLSSKEMFIVLDNAESILDPQGTSAEEIYGVVEELSQFDNICLCITSRISTIPPDCETLDVPILTMEAARDTFYRIYKRRERPDLIDTILRRLDFHPLSTTLLATVAHQNKWDAGRLTKEWERRRTGVLRTHHNKSLAATIELSLASPMFQDLGRDARDSLGIVAFFPQGIDENNLDWLFPAIPNREEIFDKFCILSLTYRSNGFVTMLAPLRDYLRPQDPKSSPLLCATKEQYFNRLLVDVDIEKPGFEESRWIVSEDVNVEHLLDVFTSIDADSSDVWGACAGFFKHLCWHKRRLVTLGSRIEGLPDDHSSKPECLYQFSYLAGLIGNHAESKQPLIHALQLWRERGEDLKVARALRFLTCVDQPLGPYKRGILRMIEASEICRRLNDTMEEVNCLLRLARLLAHDNQVDAAEEAASRAINLSDKPKQSQLYGYHHVLGIVYQSRGETKVAINHFDAALGIATSLNSQEAQAAALSYFVVLLSGEEKFYDAQVYIERIKAVGNPSNLGAVTLIQASLWMKQGRFEEAKFELSRVIGAHEEIGVSMFILGCLKDLLRVIEGE